mmetsp:Transcript_62802/g.104543  ORF Transcript_62802/g.104543 Transcript_62802/m.104543 type:complete len:90 (-) Transcript_62802:1797-2066(-)
MPVGTRSQPGSQNGIQYGIFHGLPSACMEPFNSRLDAAFVLGTASLHPFDRPSRNINIKMAQSGMNSGLNRNFRFKGDKVSNTDEAPVQ